MNTYKLATEGPQIEPIARPFFCMKNLSLYTKPLQSKIIVKIELIACGCMKSRSIEFYKNSVNRLIASFLSIFV